MGNYQLIVRRFGNEILYFFGINKMPQLSFKRLSFLVAAILGVWSHITDQFWPIAIIFWTYVAVCVICFLRAFAKTCGEVEDLKKELDLRERRKKLAQDLVEIHRKYKSLPNTLTGPLMDKSDPIFTETMTVLKSSDVFSPADIYFFENGKLPAIGTFHHPNNARGIYFETLLENALFQLREK